ncbi:MAG: ARMT1-like domain-containing protein [Prolixibacteraceae bacterium]|nr:ARMT1-like domain-containing protein [Prolixibacteraceae bacterium]
MPKECKKCLFRQADRMIIKHDIPQNIADEIIHKLKIFINAERGNGLFAPEASRYLHKMIAKAANSDDLYKKEKEEFNNMMLNLEEKIEKTIRQSDNPFQAALRYALAGNIIDFGPPDPFDVLNELASAASKKPAIDHSAILYEELQKASTVLYLGDNSGEIVLDKLFIKTIGHPDLWFATRGGNIINDVTEDDADIVGMPKFAKVISNGYDAPSTVLNRCSEEFKTIFNRADIIISKGQGNLEGLINNREKKIFFLLMVKCDVIAEIIGAAKRNSVVCFNQQIIK